MTMAASIDLEPATGGPSLLELRNLTKQFTVRRGPFGRARSLVAVNGVSLSVVPGETFALVGESGCGKTTVGRMVAGLDTPSGGELRFDGMLIGGGGKANRPRRDVQMIFQDPYASLNPRIRVWESVAEPLLGYGLTPRAKAHERVASLFALTGLRSDQLDRFPHELSGGQRQRVGIARALAAEPRLIVADEPVSALDVSIQAQILNLMREIHGKLAIAYLFISHDLGVVAYISTRIAVMYLGEIVEMGETRSVLSAPRHPYTRELRASVPRRIRNGEARPAPLPGDLPSPLNPPSGCRFHPRCRSAMPLCAKVPPMPERMSDGTVVSCHLYA